jgi:uncharacterized protein
MDFSGSLEIAAPRQKVWDFLDDPQKVGECAPGVESIEIHDADHFTATARVGVGPINLRFTGDGEFVERLPPEHAAIRGRGKAPGSAVEGTTRMTLRDGEVDGTTVMDWSAEVHLHGTIANLGARLIRSTANRLINQGFDCVKAKLET